MNPMQCVRNTLEPLMLMIPCMSSIDAILSDVLNAMISLDDFVIHDILIPPNTRISNVSIESAEYRESVIDQVFDSDSVFINKSAALLSKLFGIPITILSDNRMNHIKVYQDILTWV
eukprot:148214_1